MGQANRPQNYESSLDRLTPKGGSSNPGLNAKGNFGSATREVLGTKNKIRGGRNSQNQVAHGTSAWQTPRPDNALKVPLPGPYSVGDFKTTQIPNTGPKFTAEGDQTAHDIKRKEKSASMIWHGSEQNKNRTI